MQRLSFVLTLLIATLIAFYVYNQHSKNKTYELARTYFKSGKLEESLSLFLNLAEKGDPKAQGYVGAIYASRAYPGFDYAKSAYWFEKSANLGLQTGMFATGKAYRNGIGVVRDCNNSVRWYKKAAKLHNSMALYDLGMMYTYGICVDKDKAKGEDYLTKCSQNEGVYSNLCRSYTSMIVSDNAHSNAKTLSRYQEQTSISNSDLAHFNLYNIYLYGIHTDINTRKALDHLKIASELGLIQADQILATIYFNGSITAKDYNQSFYYALKSADLNSDSAYLLGQIYQYGLGVPVDIQTAKKWYRKSSDMGNSAAKANLSKIQ